MMPHENILHSRQGLGTLGKTHIPSPNTNLARKSVFGYVTTTEFQSGGARKGASAPGNHRPTVQISYCGSNSTGNFFMPLGTAMPTPLAGAA
jgi:hypothetical protein